jgi:quercetin dioxygenase-like cupin family protein
MHMTTEPSIDIEPLSAQATLFDLAALGAQLRSAGAAANHAETLVNDGAMHVVLATLPGGGSLESGEPTGPVTIQVIQGRVRVTAEERELEAGPGGLVALASHVRHEVRALEASTVLVTIAEPQEEHILPGQVHEHTDEQREHALALLRRHVEAIDPKVEARITAYRWHDDDVFDLDLVLGSEEIHLEVSCDRVLERSTLEPTALHHDIEEAIHELHRRAKVL